MKISLKEAKKLSSSHYRKKTGLVLIEGEKVIESILEDAKNKVKQLFVLQDKESLSDFVNSYTGDIEFISEKDANELRQTKTSQGIFAVVEAPEKKSVKDLIGVDENIVVFDCISNPDNLGAMIRTALAFGWKRFLFVGSSIGLNNNTVVRASSGYLYKAHFYYGDYCDIDMIAEKKDIYIADLNGENPDIKNISKGSKRVIILGNEGNGISENVYKSIKSKKNITTLEMDYMIDSISVAHASAVLFYLLK